MLPLTVVPKRLCHGHSQEIKGMVMAKDITKVATEQRIQGTRGIQGSPETSQMVARYLKMQEVTLRVAVVLVFLHIEGTAMSL